MKYDLTNIENSTERNAGGLCSFIFAPKELIENDAILSPVNNQTTAAVTLINGYNWLTATCLQDTLGFTEVQETTPAGSKYNQTLSGVVNGDSIGKAGLTNALTFHEYVVIYTGRNGEKRVIGNKTKGMSFVSMFNSGAQYSEKHFYNIIFSFESAERVPWYPF